MPGFIREHGAVLYTTTVMLFLARGIRLIPPGTYYVDRDSDLSGFWPILEPAAEGEPRRKLGSFTADARMRQWIPNGHVVTITVPIDNRRGTLIVYHKA